MDYPILLNVVVIVAIPPSSTLPSSPLLLFRLRVMSILDLRDWFTGVLVTAAEDSLFSKAEPEKRYHDWSQHEHPAEEERPPGQLKWILKLRNEAHDEGDCHNGDEAVPHDIEQWLGEALSGRVVHKLVQSQHVELPAEDQCVRQLQEQEG